MADQSRRAETPATDNDHRLRLHAAKTEIREGYRGADAERILAVYSDDFDDWSEGWPSFGGAEAKAVLQARLDALFQTYKVELAPVIIDVLVLGEFALAYGWHELLLAPKDGTPPVSRRVRFLELWRCEADDQWRIVRFLDNLDQPAAFAEAVVAQLGSGSLLPISPARDRSPATAAPTSDR